MVKQIKATIIVLTAVILAGCASAPRQTRPMAPVILNQPTSFDFIWVATTNSIPDVGAETSRLHDHILSGLRVTGLFADVEDTNTNQNPTAGIKLEATIQQIKKVSENSRQWFGGFAGKARVVVQVKLDDLMTGKPIEVYEAYGQTGATAWAGTTDEAIDDAAANVVEEIKRLKSTSAKRLTD